MFTVIRYKASVLLTEFSSCSLTLCRIRWKNV